MEQQQVLKVSSTTSYYAAAADVPVVHNGPVKTLELLALESLNREEQEMAQAAWDPFNTLMMSRDSESLTISLAYIAGIPSTL